MARKFHPTMIKSILVLGAGSAGLIAAISLRRKLPQLTIRVVRSPEISVIGVGEGTTPNFPKHVFEDFGVEGFLVMLVGNRAPYAAKHTATAAGRATWERHRADFTATAQAALDVRETLSYIRHPDWTWNADTPHASAANAHQDR